MYKYVMENDRFRPLGIEQSRVLLHEVTQKQAKLSKEFHSYRKVEKQPS